MFFVGVVVGKSEVTGFVCCSNDSFGSEAHGIEVVCYDYVSPACFKHLGCCGLDVKCKQFLDPFTVCRGMD